MTNTWYPGPVVGVAVAWILFPKVHFPISWAISIWKTPLDLWNVNLISQKVDHFDWREVLALWQEKGFPWREIIYLPPSTSWCKTKTQMGSSDSLCSPWLWSRRKLSRWKTRPCRKNQNSLLVRIGKEREEGGGRTHPATCLKIIHLMAGGWVQAVRNFVTPRVGSFQSCLLSRQIPRRCNWGRRIVEWTRTIHPFESGELYLFHFSVGLINYAGRR